MNLRRIIVGEVRGPEILPMLEAMSTGDGSLCTIHARTAAHALDRIVTLCLSAGVAMTDTFAYRLTAGSVDFLVHLTLLDESAIGGRKHRFVSQVLEVNGLGESARPATTTVFGPGVDGRAVPHHRPSCLGDLVRVGFDPAWLDQQDADGVSLRDAMRAAGLPATMDAIRALQRDPARYLGGQHSLGLIMGAVCRDLQGFNHGSSLPPSHAFELWVAVFHSRDWWDGT